MAKPILLVEMSFKADEFSSFDPNVLKADILKSVGSEYAVLLIVKIGIDRFANYTILSESNPTARCQI